MSTQHQSRKSRNLLIGAVFLVAGIALAAVIFERVQTPGPTATAGRDGRSTSAAMIEGFTAEDSSTSAGNGQEQAAAGAPEGSSGTAGGENTEIGAAAVENESGVASVAGRARHTDSSTTGNRAGLAGGSTPKATPDAKPEGAAGGGVPRTGVVRTDASGAGASATAAAEDTATGEAATGDTVVADAGTGDTETGDTETGDSEEEEEVSAPFEGFWEGRMEAGVPTSQDGKWSCAGASVYMLRLMYSDKGGFYYLSGQAQLDNGFLNGNDNREMGRAITFTGRVDGGGVLASATNWKLPNRWNLGPNDYKLNYQGRFTDLEGKGSWQDTVGCSGTWSLARKDIEIR